MNRLESLLLICILCLSSCAKPISDFVLTQEDEIAPAGISLENASKNAESYEWDFGDGNTSTEVNPKHDYTLSGRYTVTLKAKSKNKESVSSKEVFFEAPQECKILMKTNKGDIVIKLFDETPKHRDNMLSLIKKDYYDNLLFHRVIKGFMAQGGDPNSKGADKNTNLGSGGPGYTIPAEINKDMVHFKGALAAARQGDQVNPERKSSGSQFYLVHGGPVSEQSLDRREQQTGIIYSDEIREKYYEVGGTPFLDFNYTVFGQVLEGLDVVDAIATSKTLPGDRPEEQIVILDIVVIK